MVGRAHLGSLLHLQATSSEIRGRLSLSRLKGGAGASRPLAPPAPPPTGSRWTVVARPHCFGLGGGSPSVLGSTVRSWKASRSTSSTSEPHGSRSRCIPTTRRRPPPRVTSAAAGLPDARDSVEEHLGPRVSPLNPRLPAQAQARV